MFQQLITCFDSPAYMRRSRGVEAAWNDVVSAFRRKREEWLEMPLLRLAQLHSLTHGQWSLAPELAAWSDTLDELLVEFKPMLAVEIGYTGSDAIHRSCQRLQKSFARFNWRWEKFVGEYDFSTLNKLRSDYNEFYLLEKECAMISPGVARIGYEPLQPIGPDYLLKEFPFLPDLDKSVQG